MNETSNKTAVAAGDEKAEDRFGIDAAKMRANAREFQNQLHEAVAVFVKDFNAKHARKDADGQQLEAYGVYAMFTYSVREGSKAKDPEHEHAAAVVTGTSQNYSPGGAEGFEVLMKGLTDGFAEHKKEITIRALMNVLGRPRRDDSEVPKDKLN